MPFVSKAVDREIRDYQIMASKFPPMEHEEFIATSKKFVEGRAAGVKLDEHDLADFVLGGDWSVDNIKTVQQYMTDVFEQKYELMRNVTTPEAFVDAIYGKRFKLTPENISDVADININEKQPWLPVKTLRDIIGDDALLAQSSISKTAFSQVHDRWIKAMADSLPEQEPKDVADCWRNDIEEMKRHYTAFMSSIRIETKKERHRLVLVKNRGDEALEAIINHNLQLAMSRISKILKTNTRTKMVPIEELIAVANYGLVLGARQFDPYQGRHFSTYATFHIDGQLYDYVNNYDETCGIKGLTPHEQKQFSTIKTIQQHFAKRYGYDPSNLEVQSVTGIAADIIAKRLSTPMVKMQNIQSPIRTSKTDDSFTLSDMLASDDDIDTIMRQETNNGMVTCLRDAINGLEGAEKTILLGRTGIDISQDEIANISIKPMTVLANECGITVKEAQRTYDAAIKKVMNYLILHGYDGTTLPTTE